MGMMEGVVAHCSVHALLPLAALGVEEMGVGVKEGKRKEEKEKEGK